jgi:hypothetical protein
VGTALAINDDALLPLDILFFEVGRLAHPEANVQRSPDDKFLLKGLAGIDNAVSFMVGQGLAFVLLEHRIFKALPQDLAVDFPPMAYSCYTDQLLLVINFLNDSALAYSNSIEALRSGEFANARRERQQTQRCPQPIFRSSCSISAFSSLQGTVGSLFRDSKTRTS